MQSSESKERQLIRVINEADCLLTLSHDEAEAVRAALAFAADHALRCAEPAARRLDRAAIEGVIDRLERRAPSGPGGAGTGSRWVHE